MNVFDYVDYVCYYPRLVGKSSWILALFIRKNRIWDEDRKRRVSFGKSWGIRSFGDPRDPLLHIHLSKKTSETENKRKGGLRTTNDLSYLGMKQKMNFQVHCCS